EIDMTFKTHLMASLAIALVTLGTASAAQLAAEDGKDPLMGTWTFNPEKSSFGFRHSPKSDNQQPKSITKAFDYKRDGLILCTYDTVYANGERSHIHWFLGLDGKEYPEFLREKGATPQFYLTTKVVDRYTKDVVDRPAPEGSYAGVGTYRFRIQVSH